MNPQDEDHWFNALLGMDACNGEYTPCCLIIYLCYYAYFEESYLSISEHARRALAPVVNTI
ncbi:MAG: hypothetical protein J6K32_01130 [Clostridia bacterium]|nr:hypothetical protein [Clostridia bacterium]